MISRDLAFTFTLSVALAGWTTMHVALVVALGRRGPWWRGALAFVVPPLVPILGFAARMHARSAVWVALAIVYALLRWRGQR